MGRHLYNSLQYFYHFSFSLGGFSSFYSQYFYYPPFSYIATIPYYELLGTGQWMIILSFSTYSLAKLLWDRKVGLTSGLAILFVPLIMGHSKEYQLDLPVTALVILSLYLILKNAKLTHSGYCLQFFD